MVYNRSVTSARNLEIAGASADRIEAIRSQGRTAQNNLNTIRRQFNAPNDANIDWGDFGNAYYKIIHGFNPELAIRMW